VAKPVAAAVKVIDPELERETVAGVPTTEEATMLREPGADPVTPPWAMATKEAEDVPVSTKPGPPSTIPDTMAPAEAEAVTVPPAAAASPKEEVPVPVACSASLPVTALTRARDDEADPDRAGDPTTEATRERGAGAEPVTIPEAVEVRSTAPEPHPSPTAWAVPVAKAVRVSPPEGAWVTAMAEAVAVALRASPEEADPVIVPVPTAVIAIDPEAVPVEARARVPVAMEVKATWAEAVSTTPGPPPAEAVLAMDVEPREVTSMVGEGTVAVVTRAVVPEAVTVPAA
jgi:hypothetical protein